MDARIDEGWREILDRMVEQPSGTVTFVFTDVEGSTRLLGQLGAERYAASLEEHRRLLRDTFGRGGCSEHSATPARRPRFSSMQRRRQGLVAL
jgi:class 3 adenylate cyclase